MKIMYGLFALATILVGAYILIAPSTSEVVRNDPLPVPTAPTDTRSELPTPSPSFSPPATSTPPSEVTTTPEVVSVEDVAAQITGTLGHPAAGSVRILASEVPLVRFENYQGTNGPDLFVYLTNDLSDVSSGVNLGRSKSTNGTINYEVPSTVAVSDYRYVVTWCERFGVLFDYAEIKP